MDPQPKKSITQEIAKERQEYKDGSAYSKTIKTTARSTHMEARKHMVTGKFAIHVVQTIEKELHGSVPLIRSGDFRVEIYCFGESLVTHGAYERSDCLKKVTEFIKKQELSCGNLRVDKFAIVIVDEIEELMKDINDFAFPDF